MCLDRALAKPEAKFCGATGSIQSCGTIACVLRAFLVPFVVTDKRNSPQEREAPGETAFDVSKPAQGEGAPNQKGAFPSSPPPNPTGSCMAKSRL